MHYYVLQEQDSIPAEFIMHSILNAYFYQWFCIQVLMVVIFLLLQVPSGKRIALGLSDGERLLCPANVRPSESSLRPSSPSCPQLREMKGEELTWPLAARRGSWGRRAVEAAEGDDGSNDDAVVVWW